MLPAGTFSWTQVVHITKGITVQGQSMTYQTGYVWFNSAYADDQTIILDALNRWSTNIDEPITYAVWPNHGDYLSSRNYPKHCSESCARRA